MPDLKKLISLTALQAALPSWLKSPTKPSYNADEISTSSTTNKFVTSAEKSTWNSKGTYSKPSGGIPKTDLASAVQTSLGKADTALQSFTETDPTVPSWAKQINKPSYTASEVGAIATTAKGAASGVAELDANGLVPSSQLPSYVDDVLEYSAKSSFPATGETGKIYVDTSNNKTYRWSGSAYVEISPSLALGETSSTAYRGDRGKTAYTHATDSSRLTTAQSSGLYKIATTAQGHIASVAAVEKADITALGIPGSDTNTHRPIQVEGTQILGDNTTPLNLKGGSNVSVTNSSGTVTIDATDTTYSVVSTSANGLAPKVTSTSKFLKGDGTWATPTNTWTAMTGATSSANGSVGYVNAVPPKDGYNTKYLRADGTWAVPPNTTYSAATQSADGLMSSTDKTKLDGIDTGANKTTVDSSLSSTSTNPVQNKVINTALSGKQATLTFDGTYDASTNKAATVSTVTNALDALDLAEVSVGSVKTINKISQTNGKLAVSTTSIRSASTSQTGIVQLNSMLTSTSTSQAATASTVKSLNDTITTGTVNRTSSIPMGKCDDTSTSTAFTATVEGITELKDGTCVWLTNGVVNSAAGFTIDINGLGAKPCYSNQSAASQISTVFKSTMTALLVYNTTRVTGGCWDYLLDNNTNDNTIPAAYCKTAATEAAKAASCTGYALLDKSYLHVTITTSNTVQSALTLNVNSKGAKAIYINGAASSATNYTLPAGTYLVYYASSKYYFRTDGKITTAGIVDIGGNTTKYFKGNGTLAIPTASEVGAAEIDHIHTTSISEVSTPETYQDLAFGSFYALTAGGTVETFQMPSMPTASQVGAIPTSGSWITGDIKRYTTSNADLTLANNGISNDWYPTTSCYADKNKKTFGRSEGILLKNGKTGWRIYAQNYNTSGTLVGTKGIGMLMDKTGATEYTVDDPDNFLSAAGAVRSCQGHSAMTSGSLDNITQEGAIYCSSDVTGGPESGIFMMVETIIFDTTTALQKAIPFTGINTGVIYVREKRNSNWQGWYSMASPVYTKSPSGNVTSATLDLSDLPVGGYLMYVINNETTTSRYGCSVYTLGKYDSGTLYVITPVYEKTNSKMSSYPSTSTSHTISVTFDKSGYKTIKLVRQY